METNKKAWSQYWLDEGSSGEVFVNPKGEKHPLIKTFWREQFDSLPKGSKVLDLAAGAGSIYADLEDQSSYTLYASDISSIALNQLKQRFPSVAILEAAADSIPLEDYSANLIVSQFGLEYAGLKAFDEAARVLAPGGKIVFLSHCENGYIDKKNRLEYQGVELLNETAFIDKCLSITQASLDDDEVKIKAALDKFISVEPKLAEYVQSGGGVAKHLYEGFRKLYSNQALYPLQDTLLWLTEMKGEINIVSQRLESMLNAALSKKQVESIIASYESQGLEGIECELFKLPEYDLPIAWKISARKP